LQRHRLEF